ncbi:hypothetical protein Q5O24_11970 [Eubacteriaceae bacterium ES3]|nr:hypothetical protein Q5O24_11970 [Eubacteriaceae bacterium ES3]
MNKKRRLKLLSRVIQDKKDLMQSFISYEVADLILHEVYGIADYSLKAGDLTGTEYDNLIKDIEKYHADYISELEEEE